MSLEDVPVVEDFSGMFVRELKEIVKKAGISRIDEGCFLIVVQHFIDQLLHCLELFDQKIFVTAFFRYYWKFRSKFSPWSCKKLFDV